MYVGVRLANRLRYFYAEGFALLRTVRDTPSPHPHRMENIKSGMLKAQEKQRYGSIRCQACRAVFPHQIEKKVQPLSTAGARRQIPIPSMTYTHQEHQIPISNKKEQDRTHR